MQCRKEKLNSQRQKSTGHYSTRSLSALHHIEVCQIALQYNGWPVAFSFGKLHHSSPHQLVDYKFDFNVLLGQQSYMAQVLTVFSVSLCTGCLQSRYGIHTFRIESIAHGKAAAVDELQVQGVSNPSGLRKVNKTVFQLLCSSCLNQQIRFFVNVHSLQLLLFCLTPLKKLVMLTYKLSFFVVA